MADLKPCPFCGHIPGIDCTNPRTDAGVIEIWWAIECKECGTAKRKRSTYIMLTSGEFRATLDGRMQLINEWNRRANE